MKILDLLRKGFGFALMSMGVSRPGTRPGASVAASSPSGTAAKPTAKPNSGS